MTGYQIRRIREQLEVDPFALAAVLGVHVSTVYRWESSRGSVTIDPLQCQVLEAIRAHLANSGVARELGVKITNGLVRGGNLFALCELLKTVLP